MRIDILTLFPGMFRGPFDESIIKRAVEAGLVEIHVHDIREWAKGRHKVADDYPYGGGPGMVMKPEPVFDAAEAVLAMSPEQGPIILMTPIGRAFDHDMAIELVGEKRLIFLCGHYEGFDARVHEHLATHEISVGDYVLSGGEIAAMAVVDSVVRQLPGVLGCSESAQEESFAEGLLEAPHYTRPPEYRSWEVPEVLLSGHHAEVAKWRRRENLLLTARRRPDLLAKADMTEKEREWLTETMREKRAPRPTEAGIPGEVMGELTEYLDRYEDHLRRGLRAQSQRVEKPDVTKTDRTRDRSESRKKGRPKAD